MRFIKKTFELKKKIEVGTARQEAQKTKEEIYGCSERGHEVSVREEDAEDSQMEADESLWQPLKGKAKKKRCFMYQPLLQI